MANKFDAVNRPQHYNSGKYEVIEIVEDITKTAQAGGANGYETYCLGNVIKYLARYRYKNGAEDVRKAKVYIDWILEQIEKEES